jgi:hypothetical protein
MVVLPGVDPEVFGGGGGVFIVGHSSNLVEKNPSPRNLNSSQLLLTFSQVCLSELTMMTCPIGAHTVGAVMGLGSIGGSTSTLSSSEQSSAATFLKPSFSRSTASQELRANLH